MKGEIALSPIKDIVFDVGRVLVDFSYDALFRFLRAHGADFQDIDAFVYQVDLKAYEYGRISDEDFLDNIQGLLKDKADRSELRVRWVEIFTPIEEMLNWARHLKTHYGIYLLSNTSVLHWRYLIQEYHLDTLGMGMMASFEVGAMKPEPEIFRAAEARFGLRPQTTLFIDDISENAAGAIACGWRGIHHVGIDDTQRKMTLLVESPRP